MTTYTTNLVNNQCYIYIARFNNANSLTITDWSVIKKDKSLVNYESYQIKESDFQVKTASFVSSDYFDLTTGLYTILIASPGHENFAGVILKVEEDTENNVFKYTCQDYSRLYQGTFSAIWSNVNYYNMLRYLITRGGVGNPSQITASKLKPYKNVLSGLRPLDYYNMGWWGNPIKTNPLALKKKVIINNKTYMEAIRDLVYGAGGYIRVYFRQNGIMQIEPFSRSEWLNSGLYITTKEIASKTPSFDTTNVITGVIVSSNDAGKIGKAYTSKALTGLDLSVFFGELGTTISNPSSTKTTTSTAKSNASKGSKTEGKGIDVFINTDRIGSASSDKKLMNDIASLLKKRGYTVTIGSRGPNAHYSEVSKVKKNGIYLTLYGGLCAGTIKEQCTSSHFKNALKKKNAKMVIGHKEPNKTTKWRLTDKLTWLPRAHDDNFSPKSFKGIKNPRKMILNAGIGIANGINAKEIASAFPGFKSTSSSTKKTTNSNAVVSKSDSDAVTKAQNEALNEIGKPIRDLLKLKITVPLGNPNFKNIHTNMFVYTELPDDFILENMGTIATVLKGSYSRYEGYKLNRWYVEEVTINHDKNNYSMDLLLNPFPSSLLDYKADVKGFNTAYSDAQKNNKTTTASNKKTATTKQIGKRSDGKTDCYDSYYLSTKKGQINIKNLVNKSESKLAQGAIGKTGTNYHNFVKGCKSAKEVYKKLANRIPAKVASYANCKYKCAKEAFNHPKNLNCAERARLFKACCDSVNIPCVIYHVENHYMNGVLINGKWKTCDLCYRSGLSHKDYQTAGFNK